jgi:ethanolamine ammonia-lyase small subunit
MRSTRDSTVIRETCTTEADHLEVVVVDADGKEATLRLSADTAASLATVMSEFAAKNANPSKATLTKRPKTFAVGSGRFERVVLLRFEDDAPYALRPDMARELCEALLDTFENVIVRPAPVLQ